MRLSPQAPGMDPRQGPVVALIILCPNTKPKGLPLPAAVLQHWLLTFAFSGANQDRPETPEASLGLSQDSEALPCLTGHRGYLGGTRGQGPPSPPAPEGLATKAPLLIYSFLTLASTCQLQQSVFFLSMVFLDC